MVIIKDLSSHGGSLLAGAPRPGTRPKASNDPPLHRLATALNKKCGSGGSEQARRLGEPLQPDLGPRPDMADYFGGTEAADPAAINLPPA